MSCIWVIDDDRSIRWVLERTLRKEGMEVVPFASAEGVLEALSRQTPDAIITDIRMPGMGGLKLLDAIQERHPRLPVIIITAHSDLDTAVAAYRGGAFEYLPKPFDVDEVVDLVQRAISQKQDASKNQEPAIAAPEIIGEAPAMQEVFRAIGRLSRSHINVLITGESGTGKELVARALHRHSLRAHKPFIAINTAAIPRELLESELFGHERGAFTGAHQLRKGRFEQAHQGTLFLDEIGDMPLELQTRLLRVLAEGEFYRVGGHTPLKADVRIIAATHQDLEKRTKEGSFREDLFHRLNVIRIHLPPLRERREDIPRLAQHLLAQAAEELAVEAKVLHPQALEVLCQFDWPGNVRQLENVCRWLTVMAPGKTVHREDLPPEIKAKAPSPENADWEHALKRWAEETLAQGKAGILDEAMPRIERLMIKAALQHAGGHRQEAARLLGWGRNTLTRKLKELSLDER